MVEDNRGAPTADADGEFDTDYELGQDNIRPFGLDIHNPVFLISGLVIIAFVLLSLANQEASAEFFGWLRPFLTREFDWFLVISVNIMLVFCLLLVVLPVGGVRIGGKDAVPDYSYPAWVAMLFAAGIGIGLLFFGVLEPVYYTYAEGGAAHPLGLDPSVPGNENIGIVGTVHHWGLGGWCVYAVVGLTLAIFAYNKGLPMTLRSAFYPILGERIWGWWGHLIDNPCGVCDIIWFDDVARARCETDSSWLARRVRHRAFKHSGGIADYRYHHCCTGLRADGHGQRC